MKHNLFFNKKKAIFFVDQNTSSWTLFLNTVKPGNFYGSFSGKLMNIRLGIP